MRRLRDSFLIRFDYWLLGVYGVLLLPAFRAAHLPVRIDWLGISGAYWIGTAASSIFAAIALAAFGLPYEQVLGPALRRFRSHKGLLVIAATVAVVVGAAAGIWLGFVVTIDAVGIAEFLVRCRERQDTHASHILIPAAYFFCGLVPVFVLNHTIAGIENPERYDHLLSRLDWDLFKVNVSSMAHWSLQHLPHPVTGLLQIVYFSIFTWLGAALILLAVLRGGRYAVKLVRTILLCYAIALFVYFLVPAKGPYAICPTHMTRYPHSPTFWTQESLVWRANALWLHHLTPDVILVTAQDYFISFPSLHVALPIIVIWFLRPWKRVAYLFLSVYAVLLIPAILLLEWHYLVDFAGGLMAAALAISLSERISGAAERRRVASLGHYPAPIAESLPGAAG